MPDLPARCTHCASESLYSTEVYAGTSRGVSFLPGLGSFLEHAKFRIIVCEDCGHTLFFAEESARKKLAERREWKLLSEGKT